MIVSHRMSQYLGTLIMALAVIPPLAAEARNDETHWGLKLYRDLMENYERNVIPLKVPRSQMEVSVSFTLGRVESLDEKAQILTVFGWLRLGWTDEILQWDPADYGGVDEIVTNGNDVWIPEISLLNNVDQGSDLSLNTDYRVQVYSSGSAIWRPGLKLQTSCKVYLRYFPFDTQVCEVQFINWVYSSRYINLSILSRDVDISFYATNGEWELLAAGAGQAELKVNDTSLPVVAFQLKLRRQSTYFVLNLVLPAIFITVAVILVFCLPSEAGEKMSLGITVVLSYTVLLLMMSDITPHTSDTVPILTIYIITCFGLSMMSLFCTVLILALHHSNPKKQVPAWLQSLVLHHLAVMLCMRDEEETHIRQMEYCNNQVSAVHVCTCTNEQNIEDKNGGNLPGVLIDYFKTQLDKEKTREVVERSRSCWESVSRVLDRFLLIIFSLTIILMSCVMLGWEVTNYNNSHIDSVKFVVKTSDL